MDYLYSGERWVIQKRFSAKKARLDSVECFISFNKYKSFSDYAIASNQVFLESICNQKPIISTHSSDFIGSSKYYSVTQKVTLRKNKIKNFINYLGLSAVPLNTRLQGLNSCEWKSSTNFCLSFLNWDVFLGQSLIKVYENTVLRISFQGSHLKDVLSLLKLI